MKSAVPVRRTTSRALSLFVVVLGLLFSSSVFAGGFEVADNTTKSIARGGIGATLKKDPSALYFNPALLAGVDGKQIMINSNFSRLNLEFQRDPLTENGNTTNFDPITNDDGFFAAPMVAASYQVIPDEFTVGVALLGPSAYGQCCFGERVDGECTYEDTNAARHMMLAADVVELYATLGAAYKLDTGFGEFSFGSAFIMGYQNFSFDLVVHANPLTADDGGEDPRDESLFTARGLEDWKPSAIFGLAYGFEDFTFGASYRLPFNWQSTGSVDFTVPPALDSFDEVSLTDDEITFETRQAGMLRLGLGYEYYGQNPDRPVFDIGLDFVWENWSRVDHYIVRPEGNVEAYINAGGNPIEYEVNDVYQSKGYEDTIAFRLGGGYNAADWLKVHAGGFYETAAQPEEYTSPDWVSWERISAGGGVTLRTTDWLDVDIAYMHIFSPDRTVENGQVYNPVVFSDCTGPDYDSDDCDEPGTPPGNPQNNGEWSSSFDFASIGVTMHLD